MSTPQTADEIMEAWRRDRAAFRAEGLERAREREHIQGERNHAFAFLRLILDAPYEPLPLGVLDAMRELVEK